MRPERSEEKRTAGQTASPEEKKAGCPYKKKCGGCVYSGMEYREQLKRKEQAVKKLLSGKGTVHPITGAEQPLYYRNKVTASFGFRNGKLIAGVYEKNSHRVVNIDHCLIQDERADRIIMEGMGTQFDPALEPVYVNARPKLEAYYQNQS